MDKPIGFCYVIMQKWNLGEKYGIVYGPIIDKKAKLCQTKYWTLYSSKEMESGVTNYFCGTTLAQKRLDRNLHQFQVWAERKRGFPPIIFFNLFYMAIDYEGQVSNQK